MPRLSSKVKSKPQWLPSASASQADDRLQLRTTDQTAAMLALKPQTLDLWRSKCPERLPFVRMGRAVRYRLSDIEAFIERSVVCHE